MTVVQVGREYEVGEAQCGSDESDETGQDGKVCTEGQVLLWAVRCSVLLQILWETDSESLLCGVRKLLEGLSTNSCFSFMENRSKGINCQPLQPSLALGYISFLGARKQLRQRDGSFKPGRELASSDLGMVHRKHEQGTGSIWAKAMSLTMQLFWEMATCIYSVLWDKKYIEAK